MPDSSSIEAMDFTFMTMHDLGERSTILYASDSITEVLQYVPRDVIGHSTFEYFMPSETDYLQRQRAKVVSGDKASVLAHLTLRRKDGIYVTCECVITVVYSVLVVCTSLYQETASRYERARAAPEVARLFRPQTADPRFEMLKHLSPKFTSPLPRNEPRAAMILNRFSRTLNVMYATHAISDILSIQAEEAIGRSFYEYISPECLQDSVNALESAKANDSIAYLRFRWRDPRENENGGRSRQSSVASTTPSTEGGGVLLESVSDSEPSLDTSASTSTETRTAPSTVPTSLDADIEVEAVVSCTSDGLVVILRRAHTAGPHMFASPWGVDPTRVAPSARGPETHDFMESIRQVAVFAWSLRSINENITMDYGRGTRPPSGVDKVGCVRRKDSSYARRMQEWRERSAGATQDVGGQAPWEGSSPVRERGVRRGTDGKEGSSPVRERGVRRGTDGKEGKEDNGRSSGPYGSRFRDAK